MVSSVGPCAFGACPFAVRFFGVGCLRSSWVPIGVTAASRFLFPLWAGVLGLPFFSSVAGLASSPFEFGVIARIVRFVPWVEGVGGSVVSY